MRMRAVVVLFTVLAAVSGAAQGSRLADVKPALAAMRKLLPKSANELSIAAPGPSSVPQPLPTPSLKEPFAIGEAFYIEEKLEDAVVSMLGLMRIGVVSDSAAGAAAGQNAPRIVLSESEVRALIDMGMEDLESSEDIENLPHSFADLHAAVADLLPGVSIEQLAQTYTRAYEANPDDLVAKSLMGQPLEPETKLTRTQIWFLLMDGFAGAAASGARWGTADRQLPDLVSPDPQWSAAEWREVLARLPLITAERLVTIDAPAIITRTAAKIAPATITVRASASAPPLVSRSTGRTLIAARAGSLAGQQVTWRAPDNSLLQEVGTIASPLDEPVPIGAGGVARFVVQPDVDGPGGAGEIVEAQETIEARFQTRGLVSGAYAVPPPLSRMSFGASRTRATLHLRWRASDLLHVWVANYYSGVNFQIPGTGAGGTRSGWDTMYAKLFKRRDGSYAGPAWGKVNMSQELRGPTAKCQKAETSVEQILWVEATRAPDFGPVHRLDLYGWLNPAFEVVAIMDVQPPDRYLRLTLFPKTRPDPPAESPCLPFIPADRTQRRYGGGTFIPFNDAQWTTPGQGYAIGLRTRGAAYVDGTSWDPLDENALLGKVKTLFQLTGHSVWIVAVGRTRDELFGLLE